MTAPKTIVLVAPEFMNLHRLVIERLEELGHKVHFVPDRPSQNALIKILIRLARPLLFPYLWIHYRRRFSRLASPNVNEVFIITGEGIPAALVPWMRTQFPNARFQLYLWDSMKRSPGCRSLMKKMDRVLSYDYFDCQRHPEMIFTPHFIVSPKNLPPAPKTDFRWHLTFLGTGYRDRMQVCAKLARKLPPEIKFYRFIFFPSSILYFFKKLTDPYINDFRQEEIGFVPKLGTEWSAIMAGTSTALDIHHPQQGGLTMRTLQALAMGYKLVTTDASIKHYPFYNEKFIRIIDRDTPQVDPEFLKAPNDHEPHPSLLELELTPWLKKAILD